MNLFVTEVVTPADRLPITVDTEQEGLARAVVEEIERGVLWRAIVRQTRLILVDGPLPSQLDLEPVQEVLSLTRWTPTNPAEVVDAATYMCVTRDPAGTIIAPSPGSAWPSPFRLLGSFALTYSAGWTVTASENKVPPSVQLMIERAISFRAGSGLGNIGIGSLKIDVAESYQTDKIPQEIAGIGRAYQYRPGIFSAFP